MSHNAYVQGLLENNCEVDILMAEDSWGQQDNKLPTWDKANYFCYPATAPQDRIRTLAQRILPAKVKQRSTNDNVFNASSQSIPSNDNIRNRSAKDQIRAGLKFLYYKAFPANPIYPLNWYWLKKASKFQSTVEYDLVISNSSPAASHKLVYLLLKSKQLFCKRWIQIWEDPWYADLYGSHDQAIFQEEHALLVAASEVYYVSPLTLEYQKSLFPDCGDKMKHIPLPYLEFSDEKSTSHMSFGYFGDYYSHTRNLVPFYQALRKSGFAGNIYGDSDLRFEPTDKIVVSGRVTLDILSKVQAETAILVHLCNLKGGQIPGKIYHYSATDKPILFILDGTDSEQRLIQTYFEQFNRYYFCENTTDAILVTMKQINKDIAQCIEYTPIDAFSPKVVARQLL